MSVRSNEEIARSIRRLSALGAAGRVGFRPGPCAEGELCSPWFVMCRVHGAIAGGLHIVLCLRLKAPAIGGIHLECDVRGW